MPTQVVLLRDAFEADPALPLSRVLRRNVDVVPGERVPLSTHFLLDVVPAVVLPGSHGFEVAGPDAMLLQAQVIEEEAFRDRTSEEFVGEAVSQNGLGLSVLLEYEVPVAVVGNFPSPLPAPVVSAVNLQDEESFSSQSVLSHTQYATTFRGEK